METQISSKLAAFAAALMMSSLVMGGVAFLLEGHPQPSSHSVVAHVASQSARHAP
jgi:hypothetical protein